MSQFGDASHEYHALRSSCAAISDYRLTGCTIYTTCEPCPMCLAAIHWARLDRIVYALTRADAAAIGFDDELLYRAMQTPLIPMEREPCPAAEEAFRRNDVRY